jgi:tetratricopeptide (TPR) repeat protein
LKRFLSLAAVFFAGLSGLRAADNLQLGANENVFIVLAAINAAGYDEGLNLPDNHPLRLELREYLAKQNIPVLGDLKSYYRKHMQKTGIADLAQYISYALSVTGPPTFEWRTRTVDVPPDAASLAEFTPLLSAFYQQANLAELWQKAQPAYDKEEEKYHSSLVAMTNTIDGYVRVSAGGYLGRRFSVFVDLLGAPEQVQTKNYGDDAFVVVTPSAKPSLFDIRHAYLHFEIDPICIKYGVALDQKRTLLDYVQAAGALDTAYKNDVVLLANESLIKAVEARLDKNPGEVTQAARQGYALAPFFAEQLTLFEKQDQSLRYYVEDMFNSLDLNREKSRIASMKFDAAPLVRAGRQVAVPAPQPKLSPSAQTLEKAEDLYTKRTLDPAKELFLKALEQDGSPDEHARAWYGLARISVLQKQPDAAVKLFEKTLAASPDDPTKAWSFVYLGRLAMAAANQEHEARLDQQADADLERARKMFQEAVAVPGASDAARSAAQTELAKIPK